MKITELIEALYEFALEHGDLEVFTEGCDCDGDIGSVALESNGPDKKWAILARTDGGYATGRQG